jgi:predicted N-acetyltransferase YhbS
MPDLLVNLLQLQTLDALLPALIEVGIIIRRAQPFEITPVREFIAANFSRAWADEASVGFANKPVSVFVATVESSVIGFSAYECTRRGFFGPTGVAPDRQGQGVGKALLLASLWGLRELGYVYGIIGRVGPVEFYAKAVGAVVIPDSDPGIYTDLLK